MTTATILIIEDNPTSLKLVSTILKKLECRLLTAMNGEQGVEIARQFVPDLVLMDMQLPGISGVEATRQLKSDPHTAGILIVALTAQANPDELDAALEAGCSGCIPKPIDIRAFTEQIRQFMTV